MKISPLLQNQLALHGIILIWGFTGILGKLIAIPSTQITFWRMGIAALGLFLFFAFKDFKLLKVGKKEFFRYFFTGLIIGLHWTFFFEALHVSNVSLTLSCLASASLFTAILEPIFNRKPINFSEILFGFLVILGIYLIFQFETVYVKGIFFSVLSALFAAIFTILNGRFVQKQRSRVISFYEMLGGFVFLFVFAFFQNDLGMNLQLPSELDFIYLLILGLICTAFAFVVSVEVMKMLSAFTVSISINMEPIYSILLALVIFGENEKMSLGFYFGAFLILSTVVANALLKARLRRKALIS